MFSFCGNKQSHHDAADEYMMWLNCGNGLYIFARGLPAVRNITHTVNPPLREIL